MSNQSTAGFVYLIRAESGHYKIGKAVDAERRAGQFTLQLPFKTEVVKVIPCENRHYTEAILHHKLDQFRINGEWFSLPPLGVLYFEYLAKANAFLPDESDRLELRTSYQDAQDRFTSECLTDPEMIRLWMANLGNYILDKPSELWYN